MRFDTWVTTGGAALGKQVRAALQNFINASIGKAIDRQWNRPREVAETR